MGPVAGVVAALLFAWVGFAAQASFPVTVTDDRGRAITIAAEPQRIVAVGALYAEILVDLGVADRLIAVAASPDNPAATDGLPTVGTAYAPSVELIIALKPDLVLGATDWEGVRPALEAAGVTVLTTSMLTSVSDIFATIRTVGAAVGKEIESSLLAGQIAESILSMEASVLGMPKVTAAFLYASTPDAAPYAAGTGTIEHELILRAGGTDVFADIKGFPPVSLEEVVKRNPDVIFTDPSQIANITGNPLLQGVAAVRNGQVVGIRASEVTSTQVAEALRTMIETLHGLKP